MKSLYDSKKGDARIYLGVVIFLFAFGFVMILGHALLTELITGFTTAGVYGAEAQSAVEPILNTYRIMDYLIVVLMIVLVLGIAITSYRVAVSPVFFVIEFFAIAIYGFVSYFFNYIFQELVSNAFFTATKLYFSNTLIICSNLHWVLLANFVVGVIAFYAKKEKGQYLA